MSTEREMTLSEWMGQLPDFHLANRELAELRAELTRLRAQVPEGWVVVPREPTREMIEAGILFGNSPNKAAIIYQNMLSAAPTPQKGVES